MAADWLWVVGISLEISGAALVAGEVLLASPMETAARGINVPTSGEPLEVSQRGAAYAWTGAALLGLGFLLQLAGYVVAAGDLWLFAVAAVVAVAAFVAGRRVAVRWVAKVLHRRAVALLEPLRNERQRQ